MGWWSGHYGKEKYVLLSRLVSGCQMKLVSEGTGTTYLFVIALVNSVNSVTAKEFPVLQLS